MTTLLIALKVIPTIFMALFPVVNPIGTALILSGMTKDVHPDVWKKISLKIAFKLFYSFIDFLSVRRFVSKTFWHYNPRGAGIGRPCACPHGVADAQR